MAQNAYAVALVTLKVGVLKWTKEEIRELDVATRKLFTLPDCSIEQETLTGYMRIGVKKEGH